MSLSSLIRRGGILRPPKSLHGSGRRKNFLLAPPVLAYNIDNTCRHEVTLVPSLSTTATAATTKSTKRRGFTQLNQLHMSKQWLKYQQVRLAHSTPPPHHIPTSKEELLAQARGFFERLKIRIKYPLMRQIRPWTLNDATALFSWLFLGHTVWLLAGTTSFVSIILWIFNSLQFQGKKIEYFAGTTKVD